MTETHSSSSTASTSTASTAARRADGRGPAREVHHGRTPAAWTGTLIAMVGFLVGGLGFVGIGTDGPNWLMFWIGAAIVAISLIVTLIMQKLGLGAA